MRVLKISRKGEFKPNQDKATAICVGGHGGGKQQLAERHDSLFV